MVITVHESLPEAEQLQHAGRDLEDAAEERHTVGLQVVPAQGLSDMIACHVIQRVLNPDFFN